jgi:hypothetical protein
LVLRTRRVDGALNRQRDMGGTDPGTTLSLAVPSEPCDIG